MKNILRFTLIAIVLTACGSNSEETSSSSDATEISTSDVNGTLNSDDIEKYITNHTRNNEGSYECATVKLKDKNKLNICPTELDFETYKATYFGKSGLREVTQLDAGDDWAFYQVDKKGLGDKPDIKGYDFVVFIKNPAGNFYVITSKGKEMFAPILEEDRARKMMDLAKTFKPKQ